MRNPLQQVVSSEPYVSLTGADRVRHRLGCGHDVTRDKPRGRWPSKLRCDACPAQRHGARSTGRRPGRPRVEDPRTIKLNVALTRQEAEAIAMQGQPGEPAGATLRRLALEMAKVRVYGLWLDQGKP